MLESLQVRPALHHDACWHVSALSKTSADEGKLGKLETAAVRRSLQRSTLRADGWGDVSCCNRLIRSMCCSVNCHGDLEPELSVGDVVTCACSVQPESRPDFEVEIVNLPSNIQ